MEKLDKAIEQVENVLGCLEALRRIYEVGRDCNDCKVKDCKYRSIAEDSFRAHIAFMDGKTEEKPAEIQNHRTSTQGSTTAWDARGAHISRANEEACMDKKVDKMMWNLRRMIQESERCGLHPNGVVVGYDLLGKLLSMLSMYNPIIIAKGEERLLGLPITIDNEDEDSLKLTFEEFSV